MSATRAPQGERGEINVCQIIRERYKEQARLIGFITCQGTVTIRRDYTL